MERKKMSLAEMFMQNDGAAGMWASVVIKDGLQFYGVVLDERPQGLFLLIDGDKDRLNHFPWDKITRVVYNNNQ